MRYLPLVLLWPTLWVLSALAPAAPQGRYVELQQAIAALRTTQMHQAAEIKALKALVGAGGISQYYVDTTAGKLVCMSCQWKEDNDNPKP